MDQNAASTTGLQEVRVLVKFVRPEEDERCSDIDGIVDQMISYCGTRCCYNQSFGCPLDAGDTRCENDEGYYIVERVL